MQFADDFVYLAKKSSDVAASKNVMYSMLEAGRFTNTNLGDTGADATVWKVAGTNGNVKRGKQATSDLNHRYLLLQDGKLIIPQASENDGSVRLQDNTRVSAYNTSTLCVMIEVMGEFSGLYKQGYRFVYCSPANLMWNEGDDYNRISTDVQFLCDFRVINNFFIDGVSQGEEAYAITYTGKLEDALVKTEGATKGLYSGTVPAEVKTRVCRVYYSNETDGAGYFILERACPTGWKPVVVSLNADGDMNKTIETETPGTIDFKMSYCFPIYNFDFEDARFLEYGKPKATVEECPQALMVMSAGNTRGITKPNQ